MLPTKAQTHTLKAAVDQLEAHGIGINEASLLRPTLDEVFLALTDRPSNATKVAA